MDTKTIQKPLAQFVANLPTSIKVDQVIVFGSYLDGTAEQGSDVDVIVVSDDFEDMSDTDRMDILYQASAFIEPDIHPWGFTAQELEDQSKLTTWGYAREAGFRFA